ncbi:MAG: hypothetical protein ACPGU7_04515 [Gammaproteobacteria bacterium]
MKVIYIRIVFLLVLFSPSLSYGGLYSDDLSRCLVESSTSSDKVKLIKWMFTSMALHPDVEYLANVTEAQRDEANKAAADLFVTLMTETCLDEARKAIKYEGMLAIKQGFEVFGQVAGKELFSNPSVARGLSGLEKHLDSEAFESKLGIK